MPLQPQTIRSVDFVFTKSLFSRNLCFHKILLYDLALDRCNLRIDLTWDQIEPGAGKVAVRRWRCWRLGRMALVRYGMVRCHFIEAKY